MIPRFLRSVCSLAALTLSPAALADTLYVDANLATGSNDGSSWANAYQGSEGLQLALAAASAGDEIFVAQGTYLPTAAGSRLVSFILKTGVEIYGSFLGTESTPDERPPFGTAPSILTGDLAGDDGTSAFDDNSFHVLNGGGTDASALIDGFTVTGGNSNLGGAANFGRGGGILCVGVACPTVRNCRFVLNRAVIGGGGAYVNGTAPSFTDCIFEDNSGGDLAGGLYILTGSGVSIDRCLFRGNDAMRGSALEADNANSLTVTNCVFENNVATSAIGATVRIANAFNASLRNVTITDNSAPLSPFAGLRAQGPTVSVSSSIFWNNTAQGGAQDADAQIAGTVDATYSIVMGGLAGPGNSGADPLFANPGAQDYALTLASPAVDAGDNGAVPAGIALDLARNPRFVDEPGVPDTGAGTAPLVDIGALEFLRPIGAPDAGCVPTANSTGSVGALSATGSLAVADNAVALLASDLPLNEFGYFVMSESTGSLPVASGVLCLGSPQYRFNGDILDSGDRGFMSYAPDMAALPQGQTFSPGETWYFQLWHRDGATSNFSSDLCFMWQ